MSGSDGTAGVGHRALTVTCRFFARYAELLGRDAIDLQVPPGATVKDAVDVVREQVAGGAVLPESPLVAVNREHASVTRALSDGDEVAILPPLAGG